MLVTAETHKPRGSKGKKGGFFFLLCQPACLLDTVIRIMPLAVQINTVITDVLNKG